MGNPLSALGLDFSEAGSATLALVGLVIFLALYFVILAFYIVVIGVLYRRANIPFIACIVPFWGTWCWFKLVYGRGWLFLVPGVNVLLGSAAWFLLAKVFSRDIGFGIGLIFLPWIFLPMLAFSVDSQYSGPIFD